MYARSEYHPRWDLEQLAWIAVLLLVFAALMAGRWVWALNQAAYCHRQGVDISQMDLFLGVDPSLVPGYHPPTGIESQEVLQ